MGLREDALLAELVSLLPPGDALPDESDSNLANMLRVTAAALDRLEALGDFLAVDWDPRITTLFVEDWERVLGLPDCGTLAADTVERRQVILEKYTRKGSLTKADLIAAAAVLGFTITIVEHFPYPPSSDGSPTGDAHVFDVHLATLEVVYFRAGQSRSGDSLGSFGDARLICLLDHRKPAHLNYRLTSP